MGSNPPAKLEDASNKPSIRWYILIGKEVDRWYMFAWKRGFLGNNKLKENGVHGYPKTK